MSHISVKEALEKIFKGSEKPADVIQQVRHTDVPELEFALRKMCGKLYKQQLQKKGQEIIDFAHNGQWKLNKEPEIKQPEQKKLKKSFQNNEQWSLEKAIAPGPTLDYSKINPKKTKEERAAAEAAAPIIDYQNNPTAKPKYYTGAAERAKAVRAQIDAQAKEPAIDTIARRQKMNKEEGVNEEQEPTSAERTKMTAKNEALGYGPGAPGSMPGIMQSEKEPHDDDPKHEEKEKKKAKKIKDEAESILDMHKS